MSESIYVQLEKRRAITPVNGQDYDAPLPDELFPTAEQFEDKIALVAWAKEIDKEAELIQSGLQKKIIELRAAFKSCPKDHIWDEEMGNKNVAAMEWKYVSRPNVGSKKNVDEARYADCLAMIGQLTASGMEKDQISTITIGIYGAEVVTAIFETLENI